MTDIITAGSILVQGGTQVPKALELRSESGSTGWATVNDTRPTFEKTIREAGWNFFFMAGEIRTTVFGFDGQKALGAAVKRLIASVKSQNCNSIEITKVTRNSFLKVPYVSVFAHARHLQKGLVFSG